MTTWIGIALAVFAALALLVLERRERFERSAAAEGAALAARAAASAPNSHRPQLDGLPAPVRRYLEVSGAGRHAPLRAAHLRHGGTFRPGLDKPWLPIRGEQWLSSAPPGFVWHGRVRAGAGLWIDARDRSVDGEGEMLVKLASTVTLQRARGAALDQGALLRLLGELAWMPTAFLDARHLRWEAIDADHARATLAVGGRAVTATFAFGPDGLMTGMSGERERDLGGGRSVKTPFHGASGDFRPVDGVLVPFHMEASWIIEGRPFPYARFEVEEVAFDGL
ncbi:DUF6544 family protein [Anaeromyxobacter diazotrophicus]|uniref:Uncharacterized protein n=1 Tax=Anaeromyxobacter diazotrophicus TaxID=2590199 RepID=A0A7I9VQ40_9BACT|nr:DUF6544 family protein [Anaeromyxobacter diazotrophicus]GEJ58524.1 hypothetical protein AMYX_32650 [Anaeromyxobacter diazotrophicus]